MDDLDSSVVFFLSEYFHCKADSIRMNSRLDREFGVDGDDGVDFVNAFAARFHVDLREFDASRYFGAEAGGCFLPWLFLDRNKYQPITVSYLMDIARRRKWYAC